MAQPTLARFEWSAALRARRVVFCEGQLLPISENENAFTLMAQPMAATVNPTFALPDLRALRCIRQRFHLARQVCGRSHADCQSDPAHSIPCWERMGWRQNSPASAFLASVLRCERFFHTAPTNPRPHSLHNRSALWRKPAAYEFFTLSLRQFHHFGCLVSPPPSIEPVQEIQT